MGDVPVSEATNVERLLAEWERNETNVDMVFLSRMVRELREAIAADRRAEQEAGVEATMIGRTALGDGGLNLTFLLRGDDALAAGDLPYGSMVRIRIPDSTEET